VPAPGARLLDVGCGTGQSRQIYDGQFGTYVGIDLSNSALARARAKFPGDEWVVRDACASGLPAASFDVVAYSSVLHHIDDFPAAVRRAHGS
jgi:2-polyprenyl-6-hydroxyphenyl methylase/3-demethylubiquinone-9 3-methyltransferase